MHFLPGGILLLPIQVLLLMGETLSLMKSCLSFAGEEGLFLFKVSEVSRKKTSVIRLGDDEFRWLTRELV